MPNENDVIQRLVDAGIIRNPGELSQEARQVLRSLSGEEVDCIFSVRQKLSDEGRQRFDAFIPPCGF